ncbi:6-bladed beta-propeller [Parabacteroides sp. AF17-28]|uniref:6-bladed beta-propeller n=1 Tax=Parabacteroides sp. AF17-28 TaxID=2292241 RepID=UPI000EFEB7BF|nr:6-bladed beta-propeller [Parabacteroides sp. AF17-28]RHR58199.1 6-bladed beta-propeller [Parabacteroides sp. AF17-28]
MTYKPLFLIGLAFPLFSCGGNKQAEQPEEAEARVLEYPVTISFDKGIETEREVLLSEIAKEVKIVPLETRPECLVAKVNRGMIQMVDHNLFIPCSEGLLQFTDDGKFVRSVAKRGQGPGEYNMIRHIAVSDRLKQVYLMDHGKVHSYSLDGTFLKESQIPFCWQFTLLGDSIYAGYIYNNTGQKKDRLILVDQKGNTLKSFPQYDQFTIESGLNYYLWGRYDRYVYSYKDEACCKEYYNDTVFTITPEELQPRYILELGKHKIPKERRFELLEGNWQAYSEPARAYLRPDFLETSQWVFLPYTTWDVTNKDERPQLAMYNKKTGECYKVKDGQIRNDMQGGVSFYPAVCVADDVLLYYWEASELLDLAESIPAIRQNEQLKKLKDDDNPVVMLVTLK